MTRATAWLPPTLLVALTAGLVSIPTARAADIGYVEDFALAKDRTAALKQLVPGTEDYYYYHALHLLNTNQLDKLDAVIKPWAERHGQTARLTEVQVRQHLLAYEKNPQAALAFLTNHLGLRFDHERESGGAAPNLPTALDPKFISRDTLRTNSFSRWGQLENFEDGALDWLASENLTWQRRRNLIQRLQRPDVPNLPRLLNDDLNAEHPSPFGAFPVHAMLTLSQLQELAKLRPGLMNDITFVRTWASKLHPSADTDFRRDTAVARAYLDRLEAYVNTLPDQHNAFKAHVLFHRLALDRSTGVYDKSRFLSYAKLPRFQPYMAKAWNDRAESHRFPAHLNVDYSAHTLLPTVNSDQELVRDYLREFFRTAADITEYESYMDSSWLAHVFAETKVENGLGDPEAWASQLPPARFAALRDRIDIDFAPTNKTDFAPDEAVKLDLFVKNVPNLLVKVFEINTTTYYRTQLREVDTDVNLDGMVANAERAHPYTDAPVRRVGRTYEFPQLTKPGVYVIDFIGGGKSSRAIVRKGRLRPVVTTGTAGQVVTVLDEANKPVPAAVVWVANVEYTCNAEGRTTVPFSAQPGRRPVCLTRGDFSCLDTIDHQPEAYRLAAGIHVDRESLLTSRAAALIVRPGLFLNERPASVKLLDDVKLRIVSTDQSGISSSTEVPNFKLFEDREAVHDFRVPGRMQRLSVTLTAKVKSLATGQPIDLAVSETFSVNGIERTDKVEDLHLAKFGADYAVELLGRTGEAKADRAVGLAFKHRDFKEQVHVTLKTDARGRVHLGPLADILRVTATGPEGTAHTWTLPTDHHTYRSTLHAKAGETVRVPYLGGLDKPSREEFALLEVRGAVVSADRFDALAVTGGMLEARGLAAGDYDLVLKREGQKIRLRVTDGTAVAGYLCGTTRQLEVPGLKAVQITSVAADADLVVIRLADASKFARVHVFATRYVPAFDPFATLTAVQDAELRGVVPTRPASVYLTGRNIGDEYRYVLDRRGQKKFPGVMLDRPQFLLNPWAVRSTETGEQAAKAGDMYRAQGQPPATQGFGGRAGGKRGTAGGGPGGWGGKDGQADGPGFAGLDFLADPSAVLLNLEPDADGLVKIDRKKLGPHAVLTVAAVDPLGTTVRTASLPEQPAGFVDLRMRDGLDPAAHFTQQKQVSVLEPGKPFVVADVAGSRFETYDSLGKVYGLYATLTKDAKLAEFAFITNWPKLKDAEKRDLYSKHACHELHYFLSKKDPAFFNAVVKPYLGNKKDKTFLDQFLIGSDVGGYMDPWRHARLNAAERVLLSRRMPGEGARTARHLGDLFRLQPPNLGRELMLFDFAVRTSDLDGEGSVTREKGKAAGVPLPTMAAGTTPMVLGRATNGPVSGPVGGAMPAPMAAAPMSPPADPAARRQLDALRKESAVRDGRGDDRLSALQRGGEAADKLSELYFENGRTDGLVRQLYRKLDPTMEWAENNYYKLRITEQTAALVPVGPFWAEYAAHDGKTPFLSRHLADATHTFTEMMFALSVLDLPFEAAKHDAKFDGPKMTFTPGSPVIAFHEEVRAAAGPDGKVPVLIGQHFYRHGDRFREENGEKVDKYVTGEFVANVVYGCQVVVTNPTSTRQRLGVLVQVPTGAIPLANAQRTWTVQADLEPYRTQTIDYLFYFPLPGAFAHFPAHVAKGEAVAAAAKAAPVEVLAKARALDTGSWDHVSQHGTDDDVIGMMTRENVHALNLNKIAFRMKDRSFFERTITLLKERHAYHPTLWSYALRHNVPAAAKEFLTHNDALAGQCGGPIDTPLLTIDPVTRHSYEHLEYKPLVNARAHSLGNRRQIVNGPLGEQYHRLLKTLSYRPTLGDDDLLAVAYYLLLQDRFDEAQAAFARVDKKKVATQLQYDYCAAYLAMLDEQPEKARAIAALHTSHPVDRWRQTFTAMVHHLDEAAGRGPRVADPADPAQAQGQLAATEPGFEVATAGKGVSLTWQNLESVTVNFYPMDVELLFSRTPFARPDGGTVAFTKPHSTQTLKLPAGKVPVVVALPDELARRNVLVEVTAAGKRRSVPFFSADMDVKFTENYGQVRVADPTGGKALAKVYVKVYARLADGSVKFHKDGYTDARGRFDYASVNTPERQAIQKFAVLVLSDDRGAVIRELNTPQQ